MGSSPAGVSAPSPMHVEEQESCVAIVTAQTLVRGAGRMLGQGFFDSGGNNSFVAT